MQYSIWKRPHVKVGGRYSMDEGHIVVDSIVPITAADLTNDLARESGFESVDDLLQIARHGSGDKMYLIRSITCLQARGTRQNGEMTRVWSA